MFILDRILLRLNILLLPSIEFDGKKSISAVGRNCKERIDHYTIVSRGEFLDLFVPKGGRGAEIAYELHEVLKKYLAEKSLVFIGSDGTGTNTGWDNGAIATLEHQHLGRALFWVSLD